MKFHASRSDSGRWSAFRRAAGGLLALATVSHSAAQTAKPAEPSAPLEMEEMTVTGSYIPTTENAFTAGTFPVAKIDRKVIEQSGLSNTGELLQRITVSNYGAVPISNNFTGFTPAASSTSLRGLGPEATLVLINGRRVPVYPVGTDGTTAFVDLNSIPLSAIERVEVLKDGASALYGADAVAGVVNIILRKNYDGAESMFSYGNTTAQDSSETSASIVWGKSDEKSALTLGVNYYKRNDIALRDRPYSENPPFLSSNSSPYNLQLPRAAILAALGLPANAAVPGPANVNYLQVRDVDPINHPDDTAVYINPQTNQPVERPVFFASTFAVRDTNTGNLPASAYTYSRGRTSAFNFNEFSVEFPTTKRLGVFGNAEHAVFGNPKLKAYVEGIYNVTHAVGQLAPGATGDFSTPGVVELIIPARTANPLPMADGRTRAAPAGAYNPFNPFNTDIAGGSRARLVEFGNRIFRNKTDAFLLTVGLRGAEIFGKWNFDAAFRFGFVEDHARNTYASSSRLNRALNAADPIFNAASPEYIGTSTPFNPFGYYKNPIENNARIADYVLVDAKDQNKSQQGLGTLVVSTDELFNVPAGKVGFAFGGDVRQEKLDQYPDPYGLTGDLIGASASAVTHGQRKIAGAFAEVRVPLFSPEQNRAGLHSLTLELASRYEKFLTSHRKAFVPKAGVRWQPFGDTLTFRSSFSKGFREPSLYELYTGLSSALNSVIDPRTGRLIQDGELAVTVRGNRRLKAETTKAVNFGVVWTPETVAKGLTVSADFWRIDRNGTVNDDYQDALDRYFGFDADGNPRPGGLEPGESIVFATNGEVLQVNTIFRNTGRTRIQGADVAVNYVLPWERWGRFVVGAGGTYLDKYLFSSTPGGDLADYVGQSLDGEGNDAVLQLKARCDLEWTLGNWNAYVAGTFTDGFEDFADFDGDGNYESRQVGTTMVWDAQLSYRFMPGQRSSLLGDTKLTIGVNNAFDKTPPYVSWFDANPNGYPGFIYNARDRSWYVSLSKQL